MIPSGTCICRCRRYVHNNGWIRAVVSIAWQLWCRPDAVQIEFWWQWRHRSSYCVLSTILWGIKLGHQSAHNCSDQSEGAHLTSFRGRPLSTFMTKIAWYTLKTAHAEKLFQQFSHLKFLDNEGKVQRTFQGIHKPTANGQRAIFLTRSSRIYTASVYMQFFSIINAVCTHMTWSEVYSTMPQLLLVEHAINHLCKDDFL